MHTNRSLLARARADASHVDGTGARNDSAEMTLVIAPDGFIREASESALDVLGYSPAELAGTLLFRHVYPQDLLSVFRAVADLALAREHEIGFACRLRTAGGLWHAFRAEARARLDGQAVTSFLLVLYPVLTIIG